MLRPIAIAVVIASIVSVLPAEDPTLSSAPQLAGRAIDLAGHPVPGAEVVVTPVSAETDHTPVRTETDERGVFHFGSLPAGPYDLSVTHSGFVTATLVSAQVSDTGIEVRMVPAHTLRGRVRTVDDRPVAAAQVRFVTKKPTGDELPPECRRQIDAPPSTKTDSAGRFTLKQVGVCHDAVLEVDHPEYLSYKNALQRERLNSPSIELAVELRPGGVLVGLVTDRDSVPIPHASVQLVTMRNGTVVDVEGARAAAEGDGSFKISRIESGIYRAMIEAEGFTSEARDGLSVRSGATLELGTVRLDRGLSIAGRVLTPEGDAAVGARVIAFRDRSIREQDPPSAKTDADGGFRVGGLRARAYHLRAKSVGEGDGVIELDDVEAPAEDIVLRLEPSGILEGKVRRVDGAIDVPVEVAAYAQGKTQGVVELDPSSGEFRIRQLAARDYVVVAQARGYKHATSRVHRVGTGETVRVAELVLARGVTVHGRVLDGNTGFPVVGASVACEMGEGIRECGTAPTDIDGAFEAQLSHERVRLFIRHPDYAVEGFFVDVSGPETQSLDLILSRGATVHGVVQGPDGQGIPGVEILAGARLGSDASTWTDLKGAYRFEHLKEGHVDLYRKSGGGWNGEKEVRNLELVLGEVRREDFILGNMLFGEVRLNGNPIPEAWVSVRGEIGKSGSVGAMTDTAGTYTISGTPAGKVMVTVSWRELGVTRRAEVPVAPSFRLDIDLPSYELSGVVVDGETGAPISGARVIIALREDERLKLLTAMDGSEPFMVMPESSRETAIVVSRSDGTFTVPVPERRSYQIGVDVLDDNHYTARLVVGTTSEPIRIELTKGRPKPSPAPAAGD